MGLTLHYELRLPPAMSSRDVTQRLTLLRDRALDLPFEAVSDLIHSPRNDSPDGMERFLAVWADVVSRPLKGDRPFRIGDPATSRGFTVYPGQHCEFAAFGFVRRADRKGGSPEWYWQNSCKTQYASIVSESHVIRCHTTVIALLDHAIELDIDVAVYDEGQYWETRDTARFLAEVDRMNRLVAGVAGRFSDAMPNSQAVRSPIFEHPDFEHLEMPDSIS
jgi:hypothetical protein